MAQDAIINRWNVNGDIYEIQDAGRGHPLGVATLDENGQVPLGQLPENIDVTDAVTDGDMHPVTSNAVYDALKNKDDVPLGSIMPYYGTSDPTDGKWFICDGRDTTGTAIELETHYPSLYIFLGGTNVLPDLREIVFVGAGQNGTETIANHDVYTVGQFKDDQIQNITGEINSSDASYGGAQLHTPQFLGALQGTIKGNASWSGTTDGCYDIDFDASRVARTGTTTHGKQKGVNYIIKATSSSDTAPIPGTDIQTIESYVDTGLTAVTNAFNTKIAQAESYTTEEVWTGGYWIDGKKIYRKGFYYPNGVNVYNQWYVIKDKEDENLIIKGMWSTITPWSGNSYTVSGVCTVGITSANKIAVHVNTYSEAQGTKAIFIEYTKTTD